MVGAVITCFMSHPTESFAGHTQEALVLGMKQAVGQILANLDADGQEQLLLAVIDECASQDTEKVRALHVELAAGCSELGCDCRDVSNVLHAALGLARHKLARESHKQKMLEKFTSLLG